MKKNLLLLFTLISTFAFSQDSVYEITNQSGTIIIKTGTTAHSAPTYLGSDNINELTSQSAGSIVIRRNGINYYVSNISYTSPILNNYVNLGSTLFTELTTNYSSHSIASLFDSIGGNAGIQLSGGPFPFYAKSWSGEEPSGIDNDNRAKTLWFDIYISETLKNNLLENDMIRIQNRQGFYSVSGAFANGGDVLVLTKIGGQLIVTQDTGYNQVTLSNNVVEKEKKILTIFPNPANSFITIQNKENSIENFEYKVIDLTGRIIKTGNSKFSEQINIESLTSGNYIIQIETENGEKLTEKLIKN